MSDPLEDRVKNEMSDPLEDLENEMSDPLEDRVKKG